MPTQRTNTNALRPTTVQPPSPTDDPYTLDHTDRAVPLAVGSNDQDSRSMRSTWHVPSVRIGMEVYR